MSSRKKNKNAYIVNHEQMMMIYGDASSFVKIFYFNTIHRISFLSSATKATDKDDGRKQKKESFSLANSSFRATTFGFYLCCTFPCMTICSNCAQLLIMTLVSFLFIFSLSSRLCLFSSLTILCSSPLGFAKKVEYHRQMEDYLGI